MRFRATGVRYMVQGVMNPQSGRRPRCEPQRVYLDGAADQWASSLEKAPGTNKRTILVPYQYICSSDKEIESTAPVACVGSDRMGIRGRMARLGLGVRDRGVGAIRGGPSGYLRRPHMATGPVRRERRTGMYVESAPGIQRRVIFLPLGASLGTSNTWDEQHADVNLHTYG
jgi:hypothetical protein